ncbi:MAG: metallophosphoesterase [Verrucomicrobiota bacterium]
MNFSRLVKVGAILAILGSVTSVFADPWSFGVIADSQWSGPDDGKNPNTVAADIIKQVNAEFIAKGVKLVVAVGDTVDKASKASTDTRALYAQDLYNAGIAFYPLRGNHDAAWVDSGEEFARVYPQIGTGMNNSTPEDIVAAEIIPAGDMQANPPAQKKGQPFILGSNFSAPATNALYKSVSYSFDYDNVRFVLLDQFDNSGNTKNSTIAEQVDWISSRLADSKRPKNALVFGHKNLLGGGHKDNLFGDHKGNDPGDADPAQQPAQNAFFAALAQNHVHYYISGHDHHHSFSAITSPDGQGGLCQIICASDSNKFYEPKPPYSANQKPLALDLHKIGYYIFTVDGPRVTMEYYGVDVSDQLDKASGTFKATPQLTGHWKKLCTSGYNLEEDGKQSAQ